MHKKFAARGFTALAVNLDDPKDQQVMKDVDAFYAKQKPPFPAFVLNETKESWMEKFNIVGVPTLFVFDREGKLVKKFPTKEDDFEVKHEKIERLVEELLQKK